jgi:hypothetical protein
MDAPFYFFWAALCVSLAAQFIVGYCMAQSLIFQRLFSLWTTVTLLSGSLVVYVLSGTMKPKDLFWGYLLSGLLAFFLGILFPILIRFVLGNIGLVTTVFTVNQLTDITKTPGKALGLTILFISAAFCLWRIFSSFYGSKRLFVSRTDYYHF